MKKRKKARRIKNEDELPKALKKGNRNNTKKSSSRKSNKKDIKDTKKQTFKKKFSLFIIIIILLLIVVEIFKIHSWKVLAKETLSNTPSKVVDTDGNIIAEIGSERIKEPIRINFSTGATSSGNSAKDPAGTDQIGDMTCPPT